LERTVEEQKKSLDEAREKLFVSNEELRTASEALAAMNDQLLLDSEKMRQQSDIILRQEGLEMSDQDLGVTRIKDAELEIRRLNKSLTDFQNAIYRSSIVSMTNKAGDIVFLNDNFVKTSGYSREELMGKNHRLINSGYHPRSFWAGMWRTISSGETWRGRVKSKRKDGTYFWVDTFVMPFIDDHGRVTSYMSIRNDITQVKNAEDELMQKRVLLEEASRIANIGYWVQDKKSGEINISNEMLSLFGITEAEYQNDRTILQAMVHPDDASKVQMLTEPLDPGMASVQADYRIRRKDGSTRWIHQKVDFGNSTSVEDKILGTVQDITERKLSEDLLREFNERFELLMKATQDAIWDMDLGKDVIIWNHALPEIFGYDEGYLRTKASWWESRLHPEDRANVIAGFSAAIERKENKWTSYFRFECADGSFKHVYNRSYILYEDKKPVRVIGSIQDISDRVKAGQEIEKLSLVASKTNNGVMITDKDGMIEWVNESFSKLTGYSLDEIKGKKPTFLQGRETDKDTIRRISAKLREREIISEEIINYTKSGRKVWLQLDVAPVFDDRGRLTNFISIQTNITELKEFENSIIVIARELSSLIENANVPIFGVDTYGNINEWNSVSAKLMEYGKNEVLGIHWKTIFPQEDDSQAFEQAIAKAMKDHSTSNFELPVKTKSGSRVILLASTSPRRNNNDEITGVLFVGQNITELTDYRNNLERIVNERTLELHAALKKEKDLVKMKTQFVSIASHEFRTPLTSIALAAGFIKRYKEKITPQSLDEKILNIEKQVNNMTFLLDDILMIGKVEAGKMPVNEQPINIGEFMAGLCNEVAKANGNTHEIHLTQNLRYHEIMSDEKLLRNIVINLLTNAIKFSPNAGRVDVEMTTKNELLYLKVADYGIGIPEKDIQNLFEPFYRAGNVTSIQGTGLGLSIIKKAVELLKGNIRVSSEVGVGTEINVELPI
jgi:PAS domain S-box-containing protein